MAADDPVQPVSSPAVDDVPALPPVPARRSAPAPSGAASGAASPAAAPAQEPLAPAVQRAQLASGAVAEPRAVEVRATVHDAAVHGSGIARAIEAVQRGSDPHAINQQLGGAAASAASGQAAQIDRSRGVADDDELPAAVDPLAAPARIGQGDGRQRGREGEAGRPPQHDTGATDEPPVSPDETAGQV